MIPITSPSSTTKTRLVSPSCSFPKTRSMRVVGATVTFVAVTAASLALPYWNPVGQVFLGSFAGAALTYLALALYLTFAGDLSIAGMTASGILFVFEFLARYEVRRLDRIDRQFSSNVLASERNSSRAVGFSTLTILPFFPSSVCRQAARAGGGTVAGDAIKRDLALGHSRSVSAWLGPTKLATAILYATITNIVAYLPFLMINGTSGEMFFPSLYVNTWKNADDRVRLGRSVDWREAGDDLYVGEGMRLFWMSGKDKPQSEIKTIVFNRD